MAAASPQHPRKLLRQRSYSPGIEPGNRATTDRKLLELFFQAIEYGAPAQLAAVVPRLSREDVRGPDPSCMMGWTALHYAAHRDQVKIIQWLVRREQLDPNVRDKTRRTPLHIAVRSGKVDAIRTLLRSGADVDAIDTSGMTPLHIALFRGDVNAAKCLMDEGRADILMQFSQGSTFTLLSENTDPRILAAVHRSMRKRVQTELISKHFSGPGFENSRAKVNTRCPEFYRRKARCAC